MLPVECGTWMNAPGCGNYCDCIVQPDVSIPVTSLSGCSLYFDPRYDCECKYDYFYVDVRHPDPPPGAGEWVTLAVFSASSDNPGAECGAPTGGNPDYWGNTDSGQPAGAGWQTRSDSGVPALAMEIPDSLVDPSGPSFRWGFVSDGAAFIDNVWVHGEPGLVYEEGFEHGSWAVLEGRGWSLPDPDPVAQGWHQIHGPDWPYEGNDRGDRTSCALDSSVAWRGRPESGYPGGADWRDAWAYRIMSPPIPIAHTGAVAQYDQYMCSLKFALGPTAGLLRAVGPPVSQSGQPLLAL
jgi:hypothetical protein